MVTLKLFCAMLMVVFIVLPGVSEAWFDGARTGQPFSTRTADKSSLSSGSLVVFDDIAAESEGVVSAPDAFFVPIDTIDLDIPLTLLVKTPVSSMEALDRLMVANLRLKLLIDEYNALQKRAGELLKSVSIPYLDSPGLPPGKGGEKSLNDRKKKLDTRLGGILFEGHALNTPRLPSVNLPPLGTRTGRVPGKGNVAVASNTPMDSSPGVNYDSTPATSETAPLESVSTSKGLPWIFAVFMNVFSYCLTHRLETVFYGAFLSLFAYFLSLQVRHGK